MSLDQRIGAILAQVLPSAFRSLESRILAAVSKMLAEREMAIAHRGFVVPNSYDERDGTISVQIGSGYALFDDDGDQSAVMTKVPLLSTMVGDLAAPAGGERVVLHRDFGAILHHHEDDSPGSTLGVAAGERVIAHRNPSSLTYDAWRRFSNDGSTQGDGKAGIHDYAGGVYTLNTAGGHSIIVDDSQKLVQVTSSGGHSVQLDDNAQQITITHSSGTNDVKLFQDGSVEVFGSTVYLGSGVVLGGRHGGSGLGAGNAISRQQDSAAMASDIYAKVQSALATCQPGSGVSLAAFNTPTASSVSHTV